MTQGRKLPSHKSQLRMHASQHNRIIAKTKQFLFAFCVLGTNTFSFEQEYKHIENGLN